VPKKGTEKVIAVDNVIAAIGQFPITSFLKDDDLNITRWNTMEVIDEATGQTNIEGVFAGGDAVTGASIAVEAIGAGRMAARSIHLYLMGKKISPPERAITKDTRILDVDEMKPVKVTERVKMPELGVDDRRENFDEVEKGLGEEMACTESKRCLRCGLICYQREE
jgi:NADPH-dependent glutamate synthase beta subunit-like oxidoreductase